MPRARRTARRRKDNEGKEGIVQGSKKTALSFRAPWYQPNEIPSVFKRRSRIPGGVKYFVRAPRRRNSPLQIAGVL